MYQTVKRKIQYFFVHKSYFRRRKNDEGLCAPFIKEWYFSKDFDLNIEKSRVSFAALAYTVLDYFIKMTRVFQQQTSYKRSRVVL